jgi:hypothetical protein
MIEKAEDQLTISNIKIKSKIVIKSPLPIISNWEKSIAVKTIEEVKVFKMG